MKWLKILLGCGCLTALVAGSLAFYAYKKVSQAVTMDPVRVSAMATSMAPGTECPSGYQGFMGFDVGAFQMAMFGPKDLDKGKLGEDGMMLAVLAFPEDATTKSRTRDQWEAELKKSVAEHNQDKNGDKEMMVAEEQILLQIGSVPVPAERSTLEKADKTRQIQVMALTRHATEPKIVGFLFQGPEKSFSDEVVAAFLSKAQVRSLFEASAAPPTPAETPAEQTPATTGTPDEDED